MHKNVRLPIAYHVIGHPVEGRLPFVVQRHMIGVTRTGTALLCLTKIYRFGRPRCFSISKIVRFLKWGRTSPGLP